MRKQVNSGLKQTKQREIGVLSLSVFFFTFSIFQYVWNAPVAPAAIVASNSKLIDTPHPPSTRSLWGGPTRCEANQGRSRNQPASSANQIVTSAVGSPVDELNTTKSCCRHYSRPTQLEIPSSSKPIAIGRTSPLRSTVGGAVSRD